MAPITKASGTKGVMVACHARRQAVRRRPLPAGLSRPL